MSDLLLHCEAGTTVELLVLGFSSRDHRKIGSITDPGGGDAQFRVCDQKGVAGSSAIGKPNRLPSPDDGTVSSAQGERHKWKLYRHIVEAGTAADWRAEAITSGYVKTEPN